MAKVVALKGNRRKAPPAPPWLSDETAHAEWDKVAPGLADRGILTAETESLLASYCAAMAMIRKCDETLAREPMLITGTNGIQRPHPLIGARNKASQNALQLAKRLGIIGNGGPAPTPKGSGNDWHDRMGI